MPSAPALLARGPWDAAQVDHSWREEPFEPGPGPEAGAAAAIEALRDRGSPSHDGLSARLKSFEVRGDHLHLELQPARWALRLGGDARDSRPARRLGAPAPARRGARHDARALRRARRRGALASRTAGRLGRLVGRPLGA